MTPSGANASPSARLVHALAYDSARGRVVLFGGSDSSFNLLSDTWVWDGTAWTDVTPIRGQRQPPGAHGPRPGLRQRPGARGALWGPRQLGQSAFGHVGMGRHRLDRRDALRGQRQPLGAQPSTPWPTTAHGGAWCSLGARTARTIAFGHVGMGRHRMDRRDARRGQRQPPGAQPSTPWPTTAPGGAWCSLGALAVRKAFGHVGMGRHRLDRRDALRGQRQPLGALQATPWPTTAPGGAWCSLGAKTARSIGFRTRGNGTAPPGPT